MRVSVLEEEALRPEQLLHAVRPSGPDLALHFEVQNVFAGLARRIHENVLLEVKGGFEDVAEPVRHAKGVKGGLKRVAEP